MGKKQEKEKGTAKEITEAGRFSLPLDLNSPLPLLQIQPWAQSQSHADGNRISPEIHSEKWVAPRDHGSAAPNFS